MDISSYFSNNFMFTTFLLIVSKDLQHHLLKLLKDLILKF